MLKNIVLRSSATRGRDMDNNDILVYDKLHKITKGSF